MSNNDLTNAASPLRIASVPAGRQGGQIGITFAPGKQQPLGLGGAHTRDLAADLDVIAAWNVAAVITLVELHELEALGIIEIGEEVRCRHMERHRWPISDFGVPNKKFMQAWPERSAMVRRLLACGGRVLIH